MYYLELLLIGISLSMDAFSLAISLSTRVKNHNRYVVCVGLFHFFMPVIGIIVGSVINTIIYIPSKEVFIAVLIFIIIGIIFDKKGDINKFINPIIFAFAVSIDSFSIGLSIRENHIISPLLFTLCSAIFTKIGFSIGKSIKKGAIIQDKLISLLILVFLIIYNILT